MSTVMLPPENSSNDVQFGSLNASRLGLFWTLNNWNSLPVLFFLEKYIWKCLIQINAMIIHTVGFWLLFRKCPYFTIM